MSAIHSATEVRHNEERRRFELLSDSHLAWLHYQRTGTTVIFTHTYVPDALRGKGTATKLTREALEEARRRNWKVKARCPFVALYLERHPELADRLSPGSSAEPHAA